MLLFKFFNFKLILCYIVNKMLNFKTTLQIDCKIYFDINVKQLLKLYLKIPDLKQTIVYINQ